MTATIVSDFLNTVDEGVVGFFTAGAASIARGAYAPFVIMLGVSVIFWWILVAFEYIDEPIKDGLKRYARIIIVMALAFSEATYNEHIGSVIYAAPTEFAGLLLHGENSSSPNMLIDSALDKGNEVAIAFKDQAAGWKPGDALIWYLTSLLVWIIVIVVCAYAAALIIVAKLSLGMMIALGPAALIMYLFRATRSLFDGWVKQTITIIITYVLVAASISLLFSLWEVTLAKAVETATNGFTAFIPAGIVGIAALYLLWQVNMLARGIGGGWHIDTMHAVGSAWGVALGATGAAGRGMARAAGYAYNRMNSPKEKSGGNGDESKKWPVEDVTNVVRTHDHYHGGGHHHHDIPYYDPPALPSPDSSED